MQVPDGKLWKMEAKIKTLNKHANSSHQLSPLSQLQYLFFLFKASLCFTKAFQLQLLTNTKLPSRIIIPYKICHACSFGFLVLRYMT